MNFLSNAIQNTINTCEQYISLLQIFKSKCNDQDIEFIVENCETLRCNEKLISLSRTIFEETIPMAQKSKNQTNAGTSIGTVVECSSSAEAVDSTVSQVAGLAEEEVKDKYQPNSHRTSFDIQEHVNLVQQHDSFKEVVTIVNFSNEEMDETSTVNPLSTLCTGEDSSKSSEGETKAQKSTWLFGAALKKAKKLEKLQNLKGKSSICSRTSGGTTAIETKSANSFATERVRNGRINVQRNSKRTAGLCLICDERKSCTSLQWKKHLLGHTKENFYFCNQCGQTFTKRQQHNTCSSAQITNIYEKYDCAGEDYLAAFSCNICHYVRVGENRVMKHLNVKHGVKENYRQFYNKFTSVKM